MCASSFFTRGRNLLIALSWAFRHRSHPSESKSVNPNHKYHSPLLASSFILFRTTKIFFLSPFLQGACFLFYLFQGFWILDFGFHLILIIWCFKISFRRSLLSQFLAISCMVSLFRFSFFCIVLRNSVEDRFPSPFQPIRFVSFPIYGFIRISCWQLSGSV